MREIPYPAPHIDRVEVQIYSDDNRVLNTINGYSPVSERKNNTITIYAYFGKTLGFQSLTFTYPSGTETTAENYASKYCTNRRTGVKWVIDKLHGFGYRALDGFSDEPDSGMLTFAEYTLQSSISDTETCEIYTRGRIRMMYYEDDGTDNPILRHHSCAYKEASRVIKLLP